MGSGPVSTGQAVIPAGQTTTGVIDMGSSHFLTLFPPAVMTGVSFTVLAAAASDQASAEAATYGQVNGEDGNPVTILFTQGRPCGIGSPVMGRLAGFQYIKLVSSAAEVAQRVIGLLFKV